MKNKAYIVCVDNKPVASISHAARMLSLTPQSIYMRMSREAESKSKHSYIINGKLINIEVV